MHPTKNLPADITSRLLPGGKSGMDPVKLLLSKHMQRVRLIRIPTINQIGSYAILPRIISLRCFNSNISGGIVPLKSLQSIYMKEKKYLSNHQKTNIVKRYRKVISSATYKS